MIQAPNGPRIPQLLSAIRAALGQPAGRRESTAQQRLEIYRTMLAVGLRLLLIDDVHNIRGSGVTSMLVELREIGSVVGDGWFDDNARRYLHGHFDYCLASPILTGLHTGLQPVVGSYSASHNPSF